MKGRELKTAFIHHEITDIDTASVTESEDVVKRNTETNCVLLKKKR